MGSLKIFHTADWHFGASLGSIERTEDFDRFCDDFVALVEERRPDVLLVSGDVFDTTMPSTAAQRQYYRLIRRLADTSLRLTVITAGNHDSQRFIEAPREVLSALKCFVAGETPESEAVVLRDAEGRPELAVAAVPYLREGDVRFGSADMSDAQRAESFERGVLTRYNTVRGILTRELAGAKVPMIAMGHLFVIGSKLREDQTQAAAAAEPVFVGALRNVHADAFGPHWDYVALGHIHNAQAIEKSAVPMRYAGSPLALNFKHRTYRHQIVEVTFDESGAMSVASLPVPQHRRFAEVRGTYAELCAAIRAAKLPADDLPPFVDATLTSDETVPDLSESLQKIGDEAGVIVTAVHNEKAVERYEMRREELVNLTQLTPSQVFHSYLKETKESGESAEAAFARLRPLFDEAEESVRNSRRAAEEARSTPNPEREDETECAS
ncbi:MAG: Nuclease SbcCD subunit D [Burkholderia sp.]|jgi:DNA repair protein SbcD/Mre11